MNWIESIHDQHVIGRRAAVLSRHLANVLPQNARVLDVGCGDGQIACLVSEMRPDLQIRGVDVLVREGAKIQVDAFDGQRLPFDDKSFDSVMFVDVLHHTEDPNVLLRESSRVAKQDIVLKDHLKEGLFAESTLRFMDRVGNRRHGVALPHNYWTREQWVQAFDVLGVRRERWEERLGLYWWPASLVFSRRLHFLARLILPS